MADIDLRTPIEIAREEKHKAICSAYFDLSKKYPRCKPYRLMTTLSGQFNMTVPGIKKVIEAGGLYKTRSKMIKTNQPCQRDL